LSRDRALGPTVRELLAGAFTAPFVCLRELQDRSTCAHDPLEESIMIPPSLMNASFLFTLIPIWEEEPVPPSPCPAPDADGSDPTTASSPSAAAQSGGDADGVNDQVALRMVFKGYRLGVMTDFTAEANPGYERFAENRSDDDADRHRQEQRARNAVRPNPHAASEPPGTSAPASSDSTE